MIASSIERSSRRRALARIGATLAAAAGAASARSATPSDEPLVPWSGRPLPWPNLVAADGRAIRLTDFRGSVLIVNLWATWCVPCRQEMPSLERLRRRVAGQGVEVLAVSIGDSPERISRFLQQTPVDLPIALDRERALLKTWSVRVLPSTFVFDRAGRPRFSYVGERDWEDAAVLRAIDALRLEGTSAARPDASAGAPAARR